MADGAQDLPQGRGMMSRPALGRATIADAANAERYRQEQAHLAGNKTVKKHTSPGRQDERQATRDINTNAMEGNKSESATGWDRLFSFQFST